MIRDVATDGQTARRLAASGGPDNVSIVEFRYRTMSHIKARLYLSAPTVVIQKLGGVLGTMSFISLVIIGLKSLMDFVRKHKRAKRELRKL